MGKISSLFRKLVGDVKESDESPQAQARREHAAFRSGKVLEIHVSVPVPSDSSTVITAVTEIGKQTRSLPPPVYCAPNVVSVTVPKSRPHTVQDFLDRFEREAKMCGGPFRRGEDRALRQRFHDEILTVDGFKAEDMEAFNVASMGMMRRRDFAIAAAKLYGLRQAMKEGSMKMINVLDDVNVIEEILIVFEQKPESLNTSAKEIEKFRRNA